MHLKIDLRLGMLFFIGSTIKHPASAATISSYRHLPATAFLISHFRTPSTLSTQRLRVLCVLFQLAFFFCGVRKIPDHENTTASALRILKAHRIYIENETMASKSSKRSLSSIEDGSLSESNSGGDDEKTIPFLR
jgi:hypothetical protein